MNISEALKRAERDIDRVDAQYLLAHLLDMGRASLISHPERTLDESLAVSFEQQVAERVRGVPVAYLLGRREFYGRDFRVSPATLIPRPETELLVDQALMRLPGENSLESRTGAGVLDLGTGTGAIAVSIALAGDFRVTATDVHNDTLDIARANASALGAAIEFLQSHWYTALTGRKFDVILSNPPYVAGGDPHLTQGDLRFEPAVALTDGSADGLDSIRAIVSGATAHLNPGGWLLFEHGYDQAAAVQELLLKAGFDNLICIRDLAGIERVSGGQIR